jgi:putative ABC transport system substrate-binding protein
MRRRDFFMLAGTAAAVPFAARAQQGERVLRVAILMNALPEDAEAQSHIAAFQQGMQERGWSIGRNLQIDLRWGGNEPERWRRQVREALALSPDVVVGAGAIVLELQRASRTVPIVFPQAIDPVGAGIVASLSRPRGNATGFTQFDYGLAGKWVELLREIAPGIKRIGVLRDAGNPAGIGQWAVIQAAAGTDGTEVFPIATRNPIDIEQGIADFANEPHSGLIAAVGSSTIQHRGLILKKAAERRLPAVYAYRHIVAEGGLISYGPDLVGQYRSAAGYVDRILRGEKPADLPVQTPTKYELAINLKTARALGLTVPPTLLARADGVIE